MTPSGETIAGWAVAVARALHTKAETRKRFDPEPWLAFYDDLKRATEVSDLEASDLEGRRLLIADDLRLLRCEVPGDDRARRGPAVFFPPQDDDGDDLAQSDRVPHSLSASIAFMHRRLTWTEPISSTARAKRPGRRLLEDGNLVREYRSRELLEQIGHRVRTARGATAKKVYADSLGFVLALQGRNERARQVEVESLELRVPTHSGWHRARDARFSAGWAGTSGSELERLIQLAKADAPELANIERRLLLPPKDWPIPVDSDEWVGFLRRLGVKDGLSPEVVGPNRMQGRGWQFTPSSIAERLDISQTERDAWAVYADGAQRNTQGSGAAFQLQGEALRLPGQSSFASMSESARHQYGGLVLAGLGEWPDEIRGFRLARVYSHESWMWRSPAWTFLDQEEWLAVRGLPDGEAVALARPSEAWHHRDDGEAMPTYAPIVTSRGRSAIEAKPVLAQRLKELGLKTWGDPDAQAERLQVLARALQEGAVPDSQMHSFIKAYERSWSSVIAGGLALPWPEGDEVLVVATLRGKPVAIDARQEGLNLRIIATEDRLAQRILAGRDLPVLRVDPIDGATVASRLMEDLSLQTSVIGPGEISVLVDGQKASPGPAEPRLIAPDTEWLTDVLALTLELRATQFNRQSEKTVRDAVERLRRVRVITGSEITLEIDGQRERMPPSLGRVLALQDETRPALIVEGTVDPLTWPTLVSLAPSIAEVAGQALSSSALELAVSKLAAGREETTTRPTTEELASAFQEAADYIEQLLAGHRMSLNGLRYMLTPVLCYFTGSDPSTIFDGQDGEPLSEAELERRIDELPAHSAEMPSGRALVHAARAADDLESLRDGLGIPFADFNRVLAELGEHYRPFHHYEEHFSAFRRYLMEHRGQIVDLLRQSHLPAFEAREDLGPYRAALAEFYRASMGRDPAAENTHLLRPDPAWVETLAEPPDDLITERVDAWLDHVKGPGGASVLDDVASVRDENQRIVATLQERAIPLMRAWASKFAATLPVWAEDHNLVSELQAAGVLDFRRLNEAPALEWVRHLGLWPQTMALSLNAEELGLSMDEVDLYAQEASRQKLLRERRRKTVELDGHQISLDESERDQLVKLIDESTTEGLLAAPATFESLSILEKRITRGPRDPRGPTKTKQERLSDEQRELYGLIGERMAYRWLEARFGATPECWRSTNRRFFFPDDPGDDSLGYDFSVPRKRGGDLYFEVKATGGAPGPHTVELSDQEILFAEKHSGDDRYRILFVHDALSSAGRSIHMLPNPFSSGGRGRYRVADRGIRYQFQLAARTAGG
jgi:hypothetical protein